MSAGSAMRPFDSPIPPAGSITRFSTFSTAGLMTRTAACATSSFGFRFLLARRGMRAVYILNEKAAILKMASVLQYFANVVGERKFRMQADPLAAAE